MAKHFDTKDLHAASSVGAKRFSKFEIVFDLEEGRGAIIPGGRATMAPLTLHVHNTFTIFVIYMQLNYLLHNTAHMACMYAYIFA